MYSALLATTSAVTVWSKGGIGIVSSAMGATVQPSSDSTKLVLSNGTNTWTWDAADVAGFSV